MSEIENKTFALARNYATEKGYKGEVAEAFIGACVENFKKCEKRKALETAKNMLSKGLDISDISEFTSLFVEEIEKLKTKSL